MQYPMVEHLGQYHIQNVAGITAWKVLEQNGFAISEQGTSIVKRRHYFGEGFDELPVITHYFGPDGLEYGYRLIGFDTVIVFPEGREWSPAFKRALR